MDYHLVEARYVAGHVVWLRFRDGTSGEVDLASALRGPIFEPLRDPAVSANSKFIPSSTHWFGPTEPTSPPSFCTITCVSQRKRGAADIANHVCASRGKAGRCRTKQLV